MDMQSLVDERDIRDEGERISRLRNEAMRCIQEMSDVVFLDWWERNQVAISEAAVSIAEAQFNAALTAARRFQ